MTEENKAAEEPITTDGEAPALPEVEGQTPEQATLGVADLQNAAQVIDVAVSRGAFRAAEAAQVGTVFNRLVAFIQSVQAQQNPEQAEAPAAAQ